MTMEKGKGKARLVFLGTGTSQGVPMIGCGCEVCRSMDPRDKRLRASVLVEYEGMRILVDAGPDFRQQMLREGVSHVDAILLTTITRTTPEVLTISEPSITLKRGRPKSTVRSMWRIL